MDVKEKLVELLSEKCMETCKQRKGYVCSVEECRRGKEKCCGFYADHLISNGVTVQDGKPLDAFLHPVDSYKGLKAKYLVFKADTGERVGNCFVLRPDKDPAAVETIRAYARATDNETLAEDIYNWVGKGEPVQEWISVDDRLPEIPEGWAESPEPVLYMMKNTKTIYAGYYGEGGVWKDKYFRQYSDSHDGVDANDVLCWMWQYDLPKPPKGE